MTHSIELPARTGKKNKMQAKLRAKRTKPSGYDPSSQRDLDFRCLHCGQVISGEPLLSGVRNRNHCPYCLHSRHLDWIEAGDRLSACKGEMKPIGLTAKQTYNKYHRIQPGELMLIHACVECGKVSINRIAADDNPQSMLDVFEGIVNLDASLKFLLEKDGIQALKNSDRELVHARLFGKTIR
jgi:predicted RNA-binding Zn-ribbon protein involved in translation (DUF1610 family)